MATPTRKKNHQKNYDRMRSWRYFDHLSKSLHPRAVLLLNFVIFSTLYIDEKDNHVYCYLCMFIEYSRDKLYFITNFTHNVCIVVVDIRENPQFYAAIANHIINSNNISYVFIITCEYSSCKIGCFQSCGRF